MGVLSEFAKTMQWRTRLAALALAVGLCCGPVCTIYTLVMEFLIDKVWKEIPEMLFEEGVFAKFPNWAYIIFVCTFLGALSGLAIRQFGPPLLNLPGTVKEIYETGCIDHEDAPRMFVISLVNILGAGSLGPEAPLVAIGGGLASLLASVVEVTPAETLFITLSGMASGLAAFFGEPVGGAIFACEVIHRWGAEYYEAFIPTVIAGVSCNMMYRILLDMPQEAIWSVPEYAGASVAAVTTLWGVPLGIFGGAIGWLWIEGRNAGFRMMERNGIGPRHLLKGTVGGLLIGLIGALAPETLFWAENEAQRILDAGETPLPNLSEHLTVGMLGAFDLTNPLTLFFIGSLKMLVIAITVLAGYRGGFIFPFFFAGMCYGCGFARLSYEHLPAEMHARIGLHFASAALGCAAAINASITRTVLATPIVLITLSSRPDVFPCVLVSSIVSLYITADTSIISAARKRYTREQLGNEGMSDCWSDLTDKVTIARWRKGGQGVTFKRENKDERWKEGADGKVISRRRNRKERGSHDTETSFATTLASGLVTPTTAQVLQDPAKGKWLQKIVGQLDQVKQKNDQTWMTALDAVLDPLKEELSMLGQLSALASPRDSMPNSKNTTPRPSKEDLKGKILPPMETIFSEPPSQNPSSHAGNMMNLSELGNSSNRSNRPPANSPHSAPPSAPSSSTRSWFGKAPVKSVMV